MRAGVVSGRVFPCSSRYLETLSSATGNTYTVYVLLRVGKEDRRKEKKKGEPGNARALATKTIFIGVASLHFFRATDDHNHYALVYCTHPHFKVCVYVVFAKEKKVSIQRIVADTPNVYMQHSVRISTTFILPRSGIVHTCGSLCIRDLHSGHLIVK